MRTAAVIMLLALGVRPAHAECVLPSLRGVLTDDRFVVVLRGTVTDLQAAPGGEVATFEVDRLWKGQAPARVVVFNTTALVESLALETGKQYVAMAYQTADVQSATLRIDGCTVYPADHPLAKQMLGDAPGYSPSK